MSPFQIRLVATSILFLKIFRASNWRLTRPILLIFGCKIAKNSKITQPNPLKKANTNKTEAVILKQHYSNEVDHSNNVGKPGFRTKNPGDGHVLFLTEKITNRILRKTARNATKMSSSTKWRASRAIFAGLFCCILCCFAQFSVRNSFGQVATKSYESTVTLSVKNSRNM